MDIQTQTMDVSGLDAFASMFEKLSSYAESSVLKAGGKAYVQTICDRAKELAPKDTGSLEDHIKPRAGRSGQGTFSFLASVKSTDLGKAWYGAQQEFGWKAGKRGTLNRKEIPGEHYLQYAAEEVGPEAMDNLVEAIKAGLTAELGV